MSHSGKHDASNQLPAELEELPPLLLKPLIAKSKKHTERILKNRFAYPDPKQYEKLVRKGLAAYSDVSDGIAFPSEATDIIHPSGLTSRAQRKSRRKPAGGTPPKLMDPKVVLAAVKQCLATLPYATNTGNIQIGEFNGEFLDQRKFLYYDGSYVELFTHFHALLLSEIDPDIAGEVAKIPGYVLYASKANTRHQAVGIALNTNRLELIDGPIIYNSLATVQGVPDLRPALRLDVRDKVTDERFSLVVLHLKSMRGGPAVTAVVRRNQFTLLVRDIGTEFAGVVGGDLNFIIDDPNVTDAAPMLAAGFSPVAKQDHQPTHSSGSRLDGFFHRGLSVGVDYYRVYPVFAQIGRTWSDHAPTKVELLVSTSTSNQDPANRTNDGTAPADDQKEDDTPPISWRKPKLPPRSRR